MKVLVTGAGALLGQGIIRALKHSTLEANIVAVDPSPLSAGLYWTSKRHLVPMANDEKYMDRIQQLLALEQPDAVLIGTDVELGLFAAARNDLEERYTTRIIVSDPRVIAIADDKFETSGFLESAGFDYPASCLPGDEAGLLRSVGFPLVVKPRIGARSVGVHVVHDESSLARAVGSVENPVIQECVADQHSEYTAGALVFGGKCQASIVMRRDLRDGNTYRAYVEEYPELNAKVRSMAEALGSYGPVNFQFRVHAGRVKVFEINARFSGTTPLRAHAGFNEVEMCLRHVVLGEQIKQPAIKSVTILRHWSETVVEASELITE